jgi:two-component system, OmpR family, phosphate regulon sensor histidine kinase PhoR
VVPAIDSAKSRISGSIQQASLPLPLYQPNHFDCMTSIALAALGAALGVGISWAWVQPMAQGSVFWLMLGGAVGAAVSVLPVWLTNRWRSIALLGWIRKATSAHAPEMGGIWGVVADRTRRAFAQHEQITAQERAKLNDFLLALQASPNGVLLLDSYDRIEWFNQTAGQFFGLQARRDEQQIIGYLVRHPPFVQHLQSGDYSHELVMEQTGSSLRQPSLMSVQIHPYGEGRKLLLARDITQVARAEAMRRDFVANVSHEIRTPLTVLNGFVETLQHTALSEEEISRFLGLMAQQGQRMKSLVDDLLTLSRLENAASPPADEWHDVRALLHQCAQEAGTLSGGRHALTFPADAMLAFEVAGIQSELMSAFSNLVSNAVRYTPAHGNVTVSWSVTHDGAASFGVRDTGPGIAAEHIPRLTERFYRVDRSRSRETGGTGLGLAIVKHVVQRHGGELLIESQPGKGSIFSIRLPAARVRPLPQVSV